MMNTEADELFKEYLDAFKKLETSDKRKEIIFAVNQITASFADLAKQENIELHYLKSKEIDDLNNGTESEDDYLEALLVYIENAKSVLGEYLLNILK